MAIHPIAQRIIDEALERQARGVASRAMQNSARSGGSGRDIAVAGLKAIGDSTGPIMRIVRALPGWSYPLLGSALGAWLQKSGTVDRFIPDNIGPGAKEAKFLLKSVAPHIVIGASEGFGDAIDRIMSEQRSDTATTPEPAQTKPLDFVVTTRLLPGRIFVMSRDAAGEIRRMPDNSPVVGDPDWVMAQQMWDTTHTATTQQQGQGRNAQRVQIPKQPFPYQELPLAVAVAQTASANPRDVQALQALVAGMSKKAPSWSGQITNETHQVMAALSRTKATMGALARDLGEDVFKDLTKKDDPTDIVLFNRLGANFAGLIRANGTLSVDDYNAAVEFIDDWCDGELTPMSKLKRAWSRMRQDIKVNGWTAFWVFLGVLTPIILPALFMMVLFIGAFVMFVKGAFMDISGPFEQYLVGGMMLAAGWTMLILLALNKPMEVLLRPITRLFGVKDGWFIKYGKEFSALIGVYGGLVGLMVLTGAPLMPRMIVGTVSMLLYGIGMLLSAAGWDAFVKLQVLRGAKMLGLVASLSLAYAIVMVALYAFGSSPTAMGGLITGWWAWLINIVKTNPVVASLVLAAIGLVVAKLVLMLIEKPTLLRKAGSTAYYQENRSGFARFLLALAVLALVALPWVKLPDGKFDPWKDDPKPAAEAVVAPAPAPAPAPVMTRLARTPGHSTGHQPHSHAPPVAPCDELSFDMQRQMGCP